MASVNFDYSDRILKVVCVPLVTGQCQGQCRGTGSHCWPYRSSPSRPGGKTRRAAGKRHSCPQLRCLEGPKIRKTINDDHDDNHNSSPPPCHLVFKASGNVV